MTATASVTTCVVVWIEMLKSSITIISILSPPAWWCGLKLLWYIYDSNNKHVTTCVVVWIEIVYIQRPRYHALCHHLRGGVD